MSNLYSKCCHWLKGLLPTVNTDDLLNRGPSLSSLPPWAPRRSFRRRAIPGRQIDHSCVIFLNVFFLLVHIILIRRWESDRCRNEAKEIIITHKPATSDYHLTFKNVCFSLLKYTIASSGPHYVCMYVRVCINEIWCHDFPLHVIFWTLPMT